jgi:cytochrome c-type biogenesis protein CcmH/NrfF
LVAGLAGVAMALRRRRAVVIEPQALSAAEQRRLATLVEPGAGK